MDLIKQTEKLYYGRHTLQANGPFGLECIDVICVHDAACWGMFMMLWPALALFALVGRE